MFDDKKVIETSWADFPFEENPQHVSVTLVRNEDVITLACNGITCGVYEKEHFSELDQISFAAGPTGFVMESIRIEGMSGTKAMSLTETFDQPSTKLLIIKAWFINGLLGSALCCFMFLLLFLSRQHAGLMRPSIVLLSAVSWCLWLIPLLSDSLLGRRHVVFVQFVLFIFMIWLVFSSHWEEIYVSGENSKTTGAAKVQWLLALSTLALLGGLMWSTYASNKSATTTDITPSRSIKQQQKVYLGDTFVPASPCANFTWKSTILMRKDAIVEFVLRKSINVGSELMTWYSLTLSANSQHQSGLYLTKNNYQHLLAPFDNITDVSREITVAIHAENAMIQVSINDLPPVTIRAPLQKPGLNALVPINMLCLLQHSEFSSLPHTDSHHDVLFSFLIPLFFLSGLQLTLIVRMRLSCKTYPFWQQAGGYAYCLAPVWFSAVISILDQSSTISYLCIGSFVALLLQSLLIMLYERKRLFFALPDIAFLLIVAEVMLQLAPFDQKFPENPIQYAIPEHLYWYRATSARRWNIYIDHQMFGKKTFTTERMKQFHPMRVRILCLGSSSTSEGYPLYLEEYLKKLGIDDIEVIDAGVPGATTTHLLNFYTNLLYRFQPDIVTICLIRNDMKFLSVQAAQATYELETSTHGPRYWRAMTYSSLNKVMLYRVYSSVLKSLFQGNMMTWLIKKDLIKNPITLHCSLDIHIHNVKTLIEQIRSFQQEPVLLLEPFYVTDGHDTQPEERRQSTVEALENLARELDVTIIDLAQAIENNKDELTFIDDVHQNDHGKHILAEYLASQLQNSIQSLRENN